MARPVQRPLCNLRMEDIMRARPSMITLLAAACGLAACHPEGAVEELEGETRDSLSSRQMWQVRLAKLAFKNPLTAEQCGGSLTSYKVVLNVTHLTSDLWLGPFGCANQMEDTRPGDKVFLRVYKHSTQERDVVKAYRPTGLLRDFSLDEGQWLMVGMHERHYMGKYYPGFLIGMCKISLKPQDLPDPEAGLTRNDVTIPCQQAPLFPLNPHLLQDPGNLASVVLSVEAEHGPMLGR